MSLYANCVLEPIRTRNDSKSRPTPTKKILSNSVRIGRVAGSRDERESKANATMVAHSEEKSLVARKRSATTTNPKALEVEWSERKPKTPEKHHGSHEYETRSSEVACRWRGKRVVRCRAMNEASAWKCGGEKRNGRRRGMRLEGKCGSYDKI